MNLALDQLGAKLRTLVDESYAHPTPDPESTVAGLHRDIDEQAIPMLFQVLPRLADLMDALKESPDYIWPFVAARVRILQYWEALTYVWPDESREVPEDIYQRTSGSRQAVWQAGCHMRVAFGLLEQFKKHPALQSHNLEQLLELLDEEAERATLEFPRGISRLIECRKLVDEVEGNDPKAKLSARARKLLKWALDAPTTVSVHQTEELLEPLANKVSAWWSPTLKDDAFAKRVVGRFASVRQRLFHALAMQISTSSFSPAALVDLKHLARVANRSLLSPGVIWTIVKPFCNLYQDHFEFDVISRIPELPKHAKFCSRMATSGPSRWRTRWDHFVKLLSAVSKMNLLAYSTSDTVRTGPLPGIKGLDRGAYVPKLKVAYALLRKLEEKVYQTLKNILEISPNSDRDASVKWHYYSQVAEVFIPLGQRIVELYNLYAILLDRQPTEGPGLLPLPLPVEGVALSRVKSARTAQLDL